MNKTIKKSHLEYNYYVVLFISKLKYMAHQKWISNLRIEFDQLLELNLSDNINCDCNYNAWLEYNPPLIDRQFAFKIST